MREFKFRAWDLANKQMLTAEHALAVRFDGAVCHAVNLEYPWKHVELMQFTGLKDKNGVEIYEGDVVRGTGGTNHQGIWEHDIVGVMEWQGCGFDLVYKHPHSTTRNVGAGLGFADCLDNGLLVIGNIYEHAHLLEQPQPSDTDASGKVEWRYEYAAGDLEEKA